MLDNDIMQMFCIRKRVCAENKFNECFLKFSEVMILKVIFNPNV